MRRGHDWFLSEDVPDALFVFLSHGVLGVRVHQRVLRPVFDQGALPSFRRGL